MSRQGEPAVVTLNGSVGSFAERLAAARAVKRIAGVRGLAEDLGVQLEDSSRRNDGDLAAAVITAINWLTAVPGKAVQVTVRDGWVTLEGSVEQWYQRTAVEDVVRSLAGVRGVTNSISIRPKLPPVGVEANIRAAFERHALLDAQQIQVEASGGNIILRGNVRSFFEREEAERVAWAAPGVANVENRIVLII